MFYFHAQLLHEASLVVDAYAENSGSDYWRPQPEHWLSDLEDGLDKVSLCLTKPGEKGPTNRSKLL